MSAFVIDAWLERSDPVIRILKKDTSELVAQWEGDGARKLIEAGTVDIGELENNDQHVQQQVVHDLLLAACAESLCQRVGPGCFKCITGRLLNSYQHAIAKRISTTHQQLAAELFKWSPDYP